MTIAITGAAGMTGRAVIAALKRCGASVRAISSRDEGQPALRAAGADETAVARLDDPRALEAAFRGAGTVLHIPPRMKPDEVFYGKNVIAAARTAGADRVALHSVVTPQLTAIRFHDHKRQVEEAAITSGLPWLIFQPASYMQNVAWNWDRMMGAGEFVFPYSADVLVSWLDLDDYAEAVARTLVEAGYDYGTYEMAGTERPLSRHGLAAIWTRVTGREIRAETLPLDDYMALPHWGGRDAREMTLLRTMFVEFDRHGAPGGNRHVLASLLGRMPASYEEFAVRYAADRAATQRR